MNGFLPSHDGADRLPLSSEMFHIGGIPAFSSDTEVKSCKKMPPPIAKELTVVTDEELVEQCKVSDNAQSYEILVQRHRQTVYRLVYRLVSIREEAEDITQEVFIKAYKSLHAFKQQASFSTWLYRIAFNCALDALVKIKHQCQTIVSITPHYREEKGEENEILWPYPLSIAGPEESILQEELRESLMYVLQTLEPEQARLLVMRDFNDLSYNEIANVLGVSVSAVKMRIHRARLAFQEVFNQQCDLAFPVSSHTKNNDRTKKE